MISLRILQALSAATSSILRVMGTRFALIYLIVLTVVMGLPRRMGSLCVISGKTEEN